ncbi:MAG TPA: hypothetical protein VGJ91_22425 [Polyangiaceae bacterium]
MWRHSFIPLASLLLLSVACSSGSTDSMTESGGATGEDAGGAPASAGSTQLPTAGAGTSVAGAGSGGQSNNGGSANGGTVATAGSGAAGANAGAFGGGGAHAGGGSGGTGGIGAGGGGAHAGGGSGGVSSGLGGSGGSACPGSGHITYTLAKSASPTATEQAAYDLITKAMDKAISYYDCYTDITKKENVSYVPSVETADGNINGSIRFGMSTTYMDYRTAMHEIAHTVGIGQASNWGSFLSGGLFTGTHAAAQLNAINATLSKPLYTELHADTQHFWPYGINQASEVKSEADLIFHCQMVVAIRQDLGL